MAKTGLGAISPPMIALLAAVTAGSAAAQMPKVEGLTYDISIGVLKGDAKEYVYDTATGVPISKLRWAFDNVAMLNMGFQYRPWHWLAIGSKTSMNLSHNSTMDDYDFNIPGCPPVGGGTLCHSNHPDTLLKSAYMSELFIGVPWRMHSNFELTALVGYKWDNFRWHAINGTANYLPGPFTGLGISYEQDYQAPFIGLALASQFGKLGINGRVIGSWWGDANDRDHHHLRSLLFLDKGDNARMIAANVGLVYALTPAVSATLTYDYQRWFLSKGPTEITDLTNGLSNTINGDASGLSQQSHMVSLGLKIDLSRTDHIEELSLKDGPVEVRRPWHGLAIGYHHGVIWNQIDWQTTGLFDPPLPPLALTANADFDSQSPIMGGFLGYNWLMGNWIVGVEGDLSKTTANKTVVGVPGTIGPLIGSIDSVVVDTGLDGSLRLKVGALVNPRLHVYATGGLAFQRVNARMTCLLGGGWCVADRYEETSKTLTGWTIGVGGEWNIAGNWFTRAEYRFTDLGSFSHSFFTNAPIDTVHATTDVTNHRVTLGLGYRF